jgi:hypothetical protein
MISQGSGKHEKRNQQEAEVNHGREVNRRIAPSAASTGGFYNYFCHRSLF